MALKIDAKFEGKLTIAFKNGMRSLANFHQSTRKSQNCNLQKSYVSWQWRMMHNLKKNWLASSKLTWRIWRILTLALKNLKNLHFNGLFLIKVYNVWAKKVQREVMFPGREDWCNIGKNTDFAFENDIDKYPQAENSDFILDSQAKK